MAPEKKDFISRSLAQESWGQAPASSERELGISPSCRLLRGQEGYVDTRKKGEF